MNSLLKLLKIDLFQQKNEIQKIVELCFIEFYEPVYWYARARYKMYPEDVAQETFKKFHLALLKGLEMNFQVKEDILKYLITIARNLTTDELGRAQRIIFVEDFSFEKKTLDPFAKINIESDLETKLSLLYPKHVLMLRLRISGYSYKEIADKLGVNVETVRKALFRCRQKLKILLE